MLFRFYKTEKENIKNNFNITLIFTIAQTLIILYLLFGMNEFKKNERVVFIPPGAAQFHDKFWIEGDKADNNYLMVVGNYVADCVFNITPETIERKLSGLAFFTKGDSNGKIKAWANSEASNVIAGNLSTVFFQKSFDIKDNTITITGNLQSYVGAEQRDLELVKLVLRYSIQNGFFYIESIEVTKSGTAGEKK